VLLSDEGTITKAFYPPNPVLTGMSPVPGMPGPTFILYPNYPNPFNPETVIRYNLSRSMDISLSVYDISGRRIARLIHARQSAGTHSIRFNATSIASGIYLYTLNGAGMQSSRTMLVMK
ncbi:MAG: T9SS C-terminal target domain-containing protein, partial [Calditrichaeota bacterium]